MAKRSGRSVDARRLVVRMGAEAAFRLAVGVDIGARQNALLFQDDILDDAAVSLRH